MGQGHHVLLLRTWQIHPRFYTIELVPYSNMQHFIVLLVYQFQKVNFFYQL
jgi:hypothetical protein